MSLTRIYLTQKSLPQMEPRQARLASWHGTDLREKERELLIKLGFAQGGLETLIPAESGVDLRKVNQLARSLVRGNPQRAP